MTQQELEHITLRELLIRYWAVDYARWTHTSQIVHMTYMLVRIVSAIGGSSPPMLKPDDFNIYESGSTSNKGQITTENFGVLKTMMDAYIIQR